jgi:hypothetical protein
VTELTDAFRNTVRQFAKRFIHHKVVEAGGAWETQIAGYFFAWTKDKKCYRFHRNSLDDFKEFLANQSLYEGRDFTIEVEPIYQPIEAEFEHQGKFSTPRPKQVSIVEQLRKRDPLTKFLGLQMGGGKMYLSTVSMAFWKSMTLMFLLPRYVEKTVRDLKEVLKLEDQDVYTIGGTANLSDFIRNVNDMEHKPKVVVLSSVTYQYWLTLQSEMDHGEPVHGFDCTPEEFFQHCGFGHRVIDETHQYYNLNFQLDLHTHVESALSMSATFKTRDEYLKTMYDLAYPKEVHCVLPELDIFTRVAAWHYDFIDLRGIKTSAWGRTSYSHVEYEKSLLKNKKVLKQYLLMVNEVVRKTYQVDRKPGEKCLIYFSTTAMCEAARDILRMIHPQLNITKFNQGDPYSNLVDADICCATLGKAGTNVDLKNLTTVILTIGIDSIQSNLQAYGRMRDNKALYGSTRDPLFVYFVCNNFRKHRDYDKAKTELLKPISIGFDRMSHNVSLGVV